MARADAAGAAAEANSATALLRPQISVTANALDANEPQVGMPIARQAYGAATLSVPLFTPSNRVGARAARESALAATTGIEATSDDAVLTTVIAYRRVQLADAVLGARQTAVTDRERHLNVTEQRIVAGKAARYLALRDRAALATAQQAQEDAASERDQAANALQALLDLNFEPVSVEPLLPLSFSESRDALLARAIKQRPSLRAAEQRVVAAGSGIAASQAAFLPSATLTAQSYNGDSSPALGRGGGQVQLTASLPIIDGGSRSAATSRARAQYDRAVAARDQARIGVRLDVANAWREYEAATRNLATASAAVADAQEQLRLAEVRETAGKAIDVEVLDALAVDAVARETVARSVARYDVAIATLHHAAGDSLP